jgi:hypothetical protein
MFCQYTNIFGQVGTGAHSYRIYNIAIVDLLFTIIAAYIYSMYTSYDFINVLLVVLIIGIIMHRLFCVRTTVDKLLFY